jgi:hypothetical protein
VGKGRDFGRSGQEKTSGLALTINGPLDGEENAGHSLYLVDRDLIRQSLDKPLGITLSCGKDHQVVHGHVSPVPLEMLNEGGFPRLARTFKKNNRIFPKALL